MSNPEVNMFRTKKSTTHCPVHELNIKRAHFQAMMWHRCADGHSPSKDPCEVLILLISKNRDTIENCILIDFLKVVLEKTNYMQ